MKSSSPYYAVSGNIHIPTLLHVCISIYSQSVQFAGIFIGAKYITVRP